MSDGVDGDGDCSFGLLSARDDVVVVGVTSLSLVPLSAEARRIAGEISGSSNFIESV